MSQLSQTPPATQGEDWDRFVRDSPTASQNSVAFPGYSEGPDTQAASPTEASGKGKRTLSELLKLHAQKGTDVNFSPEEANRLAEVLGQWINSGSSPYEAEDDFFASSQSQDDSSLPSSRRSAVGACSDPAGRPRGQSESVVRMSS